MSGFGTMYESVKTTLEYKGILVKFEKGYDMTWGEANHNKPRGYYASIFKGKHKRGQVRIKDWEVYLYDKPFGVTLKANTLEKAIEEVKRFIDEYVDTSSNVQSYPRSMFVR